MAGLRRRVTGLSHEQVLERRVQSGENRLPSEKDVSAWMILFNQFKSPLVYIILLAGVVSLILGEAGDFFIIMAVVVVDVVLGFFQEYQAQRTYVALKGLLKPTTTVIRNGQREEVEVWELVPGDLVLLTMGEKSPAMVKSSRLTRLSIDEAILTGESEPVNKQPLSQIEKFVAENDYRDRPGPSARKVRAASRIDSMARSAASIRTPSPSKRIASLR